jgi:hypothetical protein
MRIESPFFLNRLQVNFLAFRELDITATDLSSQVLSDVLTRIPGLTWLAAGQLDGMTDEVSLKGLSYELDLVFVDMYG